MDSGTILGYSFGYLAALVGIFLLYLPHLLLLVALLVAAGFLQLVVLPFAVLLRKLRRGRPQPTADSSWILNPSDWQPSDQLLLPRQQGPAPL